MNQHILLSREVAPDQVHDMLGRHVLADGFRLVYDTRASRGSWVVDARSGERYLDLYTFFASAPQRFVLWRFVCKLLRLDAGLRTERFGP